MNTPEFDDSLYFLSYDIMISHALFWLIIQLLYK